MSLYYSDANGGCGFPEVEEIAGKSARSARKELPEIVLSRRGLIKGKGIMVIFTISKHGESVSIGTGSMKRISGLWIHLIWSYGCGVMRC